MDWEHSVGLQGSAEAPMRETGCPGGSHPLRSPRLDMGYRHCAHHATWLWSLNTQDHPWGFATANPKRCPHICPRDFKCTFLSPLQFLLGNLASEKLAGRHKIYVQAWFRQHY